ncbi:MAG: hypothetical protein QW666_01470, partial [Candidatus Woesearchaeota archaeon]
DMKRESGKNLDLIIGNSTCRAEYNGTHVYHGISFKNIKKHHGGVIDPANFAPEDDIAECVKNYFKILGKRYVHLGSLDTAGLQNPAYDLHFCFDINKLKQVSKEILFLNYDLWTRIGFYEQPKRDYRKYQKNLFLDDYTTETETEVLVDKLDTKAAEYVLVYDRKTRAELGKFMQKNKMSVPIKACRRVIPAWMIPKGATT